MSLHVTGLSRWKPLDLEADPGEYAARLAAEHPATPQADLVAAGVAGFAGSLGRRHAETDTLLLAAWLFLPSDEVLAPLAHATLRALRVRPGETAEEVVASTLAGLEPYGEPATTPLATASGPATATVHRSVHRVDGEREVHQHAQVLWMRPDDGLAVVLAAVAADLVEAHEMPGALLQLAEGVHGL